MPNYTAKYQFPSPKPNESADGPTGFQQLAQKIEDVLFAQFGKVTPGTTTEITLRGATAPGDPLLADLRGTRSGNWNVTGSETVGTGLTVTTGDITAAAGHIAAGTPAGSIRYFRALATIGGVAYEARFQLSSGGVPAISAIKAGSATHILYAETDGDVTHTYGSVNRPLIFAAQNGSQQMPISGKTSTSKAVTFSTGRFSHEPSMQVTPMTSSSNQVCASSSNGSASGVTLYVSCEVAAGYDYYVHWHATQVASASAYGRQAPSFRETGEPPVVGEVPVTCHTAGCANSGIAIPILVSEVLPEGAACGVCGFDIEDVGPVRRRTDLR